MGRVVAEDVPLEGLAEQGDVDVQRADRVVRPYRNCTRISAGEAVQRQAE